MAAVAADVIEVFILIFVIDLLMRQNDDIWLKKILSKMGIVEEKEKRNDKIVAGTVRTDWELDERE